MALNNFELSKKIITNIEDLGYKNWTLVQEKVIPLIMKSKDVLGCAQTGTGKTAAFALPIIQKIYDWNIKNNIRFDSPRKTQALILAPTRELAFQIFDNIKNYAKKMNIKTIAIFGGISKRRQIELLEAGYEIIVGTPGRVMDLINCGELNIEDVKYRVLDEADHMLDIGFLEDITKIISLIKSPELTLMLSATISPEIKKLAKMFLSDDYEYVEVSPPHSTAETVEQNAIVTSSKNFVKIIQDCIIANDIKSSIIFTKTKVSADSLEKNLISLGLNARAIYGGKDQRDRNRIIQDFKANKIEILVATDVVARGIDIPNVSYVFNYHLPENIESYIHRIGRTGRATKSGNALSLVDSYELDILQRIKKLTNDKLKAYKTDSYDSIGNIEEYEIPKVNFYKKRNNYSKNKNQAAKPFKFR